MGGSAWGQTCLGFRVDVRGSGLLFGIIYHLGFKGFGVVVGLGLMPYPHQSGGAWRL